MKPNSIAGGENTTLFGAGQGLKARGVFFCSVYRPCHDRTVAAPPVFVANMRTRTDAPLCRNVRYREFGGAANSRPLSTRNRPIPSDRARSGRPPPRKPHGISKSVCRSRHLLRYLGLRICCNPDHNWRWSAHRAGVFLKAASMCGVPSSTVPSGLFIGPGSCCHRTSFRPTQDARLPGRARCKSLFRRLGRLFPFFVSRAVAASFVARRRTAAPSGPLLPVARHLIGGGTGLVEAPGWPHSCVRIADATDPPADGITNVRSVSNRHTICAVMHRYPS